MNKNIKVLIQQLSALLILIAAAMYLFFPAVAPYLMVIGVAGYGATTLTMPYLGESIRGKRLFNMQVFAILIMVVGAYLMFNHINEWIVALLISAILTLYSSVLLNREYKKEQKDKEESQP